MLAPPPLASEFVGMASYAPTYFLDLMDDDGESDGSSIGDVAPSHRLSWECTMADPPGHPPAEAESSQARTSLDPHAETPELTLEHGEELRQRWLHQPPTAPPRSAHLVAPRARRPEGGARGRAHRVQHNTMDRGNDPPHFARANQNIAAAAMLLRGQSKLNDPHEQAIHRNLRALVETTVVQQAESSASRH